MLTKFWVVFILLFLLWEIKLSMTLYIPHPLDSILLAVFTVSPNKQYLGMDRPTIPGNINDKNIY